MNSYIFHRYGLCKPSQAVGIIRIFYNLCYEVLVAVLLHVWW